MIHVLSLGAGVQSSALALLATLGHVKPMPRLAIFADTGWEPTAVYDWLDWLETQLLFPVVRVSAGNIRADHLAGRSTMPFFSRGDSDGMARRKCTSEYKISPIESYLRQEVLKLKPRQHAPREPVITQWRGISTDEAHRMQAADVPWMVTRFPLAMELGWSRGRCSQWIQKHWNRTPPRSACIGCPFHSDDEWRAIRERPDEWADALAFDAAIRNVPGMRDETFLHHDRIPLGHVEFRKDKQRDLWGEECEGMCGI